MSKETNTRHKPPVEIDRTPVYPFAEARTIVGHLWQTMRAQDAKDERLWEFNLDTGRLLQVQWKRRY